MFTKFCLALTLASTALALSVNAPSSVTSGGQITITWSSTSSDPVFSIELTHPSFNNDFGIANNVNPSTNSLTIGLPSVPAEDGYTLEFVNITDINQVYATSPSFSIGAEVSSSASTASGGAAPTGSETQVSGSMGASVTSSGPGSTTVSGSSVKASSTAPSTVSGSGSSSGSPSPSPTTGAAAARAIPAGTVLLALAGAAFVL